jgi:hypothetical protein
MKQGASPFEAKRNACEANGCYAIATRAIAVKAGHYGTVNLYLCEDCAYKFEEE